MVVGLSNIGSVLDQVVDWQVVVYNSAAVAAAGFVRIVQALGLVVD